MAAFLSGRKLLLLGFIIVLLIGIPLTVYLVQQQQKTQIAAAKSTVLSLKPATLQTNVGKTENFDVEVNPGNNKVSFVKLVITYDAAKLETSADKVKINTAAFPPPALAGPIVTAGNISLTVSVGADPSKAISSTTRVATIEFKALAATLTTGTKINIEQNQSQALSVGTSDQFNEDVLLATNPATVTILNGAGGPGVTPTPTPTPTPGAANQVPVCTALNLDKQPTGTAPYTINFTAIGNDPDGTIAKVTFNWGDGPTQDVTDKIAGGGIETASVNTQLVHIYNNPGTYTATATLTDNRGGVSAVGSCTKSITITGASPAAGTGVGTIVTVSPTPSGSPSATLAPTPAGVAVTTPPPTTLPPVGPGDLLVKIGGLGIILTILGALVLLAL